ncbi:16700_t:CDS:2 [Gigaspora margarita]|uniref:16700_t:CDS:1 n=1 Tax=Gigaspora margarita TaxID=4874 RepID=A0ABN7VXW8_GIGMA|nr:16700_t:CDS:2 [Gigaspora margarita]
MRFIVEDNKENNSYLYLEPTLEKDWLLKVYCQEKRDNQLRHFRTYCSYRDTRLRKEYLKQKKRESRVKLKSLVVDRKEKNQVVDQTKNIEVVDLPEKELVVDEQVVDISKVVDQKNSMSTTEEIVDKKNNVEPLKVSQVEQKIEPGLVEQLNQQILELKEQLAQEKEEKAN